MNDKVEGTRDPDTIDLRNSGSPDNADGKDGWDMITGNSRANHIAGGGGDDRIYGNAGDDVIRGGGGNDYLHGGKGNDTLHAGYGTDMLFGAKGQDTFVVPYDKGSSGITHIRDAQKGESVILQGIPQAAKMEINNVKELLAGARVSLNDPKLADNATAERVPNAKTGMDDIKITFNR